MALNSTDKIQKAQKLVEQINQKSLSKYIKSKNQRHVKEQNEPVLDSIIEKFTNSYAENVVADSMLKIYKEIV